MNRPTVSPAPLPLPPRPFQPHPSSTTPVLTPAARPWSSQHGVLQAAEYVHSHNAFRTGERPYDGPTGRRPEPRVCCRPPVSTSSDTDRVCPLEQESVQTLCLVVTGMSDYFPFPGAQPPSIGPFGEGWEKD